ncbi:MAG: ATP-binding protein [Deltaproteobacteria bacterium]|nr:ATP-binding protein [Deltaproteobacteria bacterium]
MAGPRQVGKTTLAKQWGNASLNGYLYYNWDDEKTRRSFRKDSKFFESQAREKGGNCRIILDEIHKIPQWKTVLKGYFDTLGDQFSFFVTGSARLEILQRTGDSMLGRYHLLHLYPLHPFEAEKKETQVVSPATLNTHYEEILGTTPCSIETIKNLLVFSGFPEIFLKQSERSLTLWHREYLQRLIREDLRDLSRITDLLKLEHLIEILPHKVGSPLSLNSLREDLLCSHDTVKSMIHALEKLYIILLIPPYHKRIPYSLRKESKLYFLDWTLVPEEGARFENFVAIQLISFCHMINDGGWGNLDLFYVRDKQKKEVDFLITNNHKPVFLVEVKIKPSSHTKELEYFGGKLRPLAKFQVVAEPHIFKQIKKDLWVLSINRFFNLLWKVPGLV